MDNFEKEIMTLRKSIEQLEMQKIAIEHKLVEQNYLVDETNQLNLINSYAILNDKNNTSLHEDLTKTLNFKPFEKEDTTVQTRFLEPEDDRHNSWKNLELSPIKNSETNSNPQRRDAFDDHHLPQYHSVGSNQQILNIDDYQSAGSNTSNFRRMSFKNERIEPNPPQVMNHRRFESNPISIEKRRNSLSKPAAVNVNLKKLMDSSIDQGHNSSVDIYNASYKPRKSLNMSGTMREENYLNLPLQTHHKTILPAPEQQPQHPQYTHHRNSTGGGGNIPLKTIAEEHTTFRDAPKNNRRLSVPSSQMTSSYAQNKLKQTLANKENSRRASTSTLRNNISSGNSISIDKTAPITDHYHSLINSSSTGTIDYSSYQTSSKNHLSTKRYPSNERLHDPSIMLAAAQIANKSIPSTSYAVRSRSLENATHKNLGFEPPLEETMRPQGNPLFDLSNYASLPIERQESSFIRFAQGKLTTSTGGRGKIDHSPIPDTNIVETVFFLILLNINFFE